jgi:predicted DNA-binding protein (UPF0251 family)
MRTKRKVHYRVTVDLYTFKCISCPLSLQGVFLSADTLLVDANQCQHADAIEQSVCSGSLTVIVSHMSEARMKVAAALGGIREVRLHGGGPVVPT